MTRLAPQRRVVHAGDVIYQAGERFANLYVLNSGFFKIVNLSADGREQVVGLKFRGDWLGFDGIANAALRAATRSRWTPARSGRSATTRCSRPAPAQPALLTALHEAMSREIARDRDSLMSVCTLAGRCARRRVPALLGRFAGQARPAHRPDHAAHDARRDRQLPRHDAGDREPRAVAAGARQASSRFAEKGRRDIHIPDVDALSAFVQRCLGRRRRRCSDAAALPLERRGEHPRDRAAPVRRGV